MKKKIYLVTFTSHDIQTCVVTVVLWRDSCKLTVNCSARPRACTESAAVYSRPVENDNDPHP